MISAAWHHAKESTPDLFVGLIVVLYQRQQLLQVVREPVTGPVADIGVARIHPSSESAIVIAMARDDDAIERTLVHLDEWVDRLGKARVRVHAQLHTSSLRPGARWTDLSDLDNPGGQIPAPLPAPATRPPDAPESPRRTRLPFSRRCGGRLAPNLQR